MKPKTLQQLQKQIHSLLLVVRDIQLVWDNSLTDMVEVMLQNASTSSFGCINYSHERDEQRVLNVNTALKALSKHHNYHFINWVSEEYDMLVTGTIMSEELTEHKTF